MTILFRLPNFCLGGDGHEHGRQTKLHREAQGRIAFAEHFSLREFRLVAKLRFEGAADEEIVERAVSENLFQYPTLSNAARMARTCCCVSRP